MCIGRMATGNADFLLLVMHILGLLNSGVKAKILCMSICKIQKAIYPAVPEKSKQAHGSTQGFGAGKIKVIENCLQVSMTQQGHRDSVPLSLWRKCYYGYKIKRNRG